MTSSCRSNIPATSANLRSKQRSSFCAFRPLAQRSHPAMLSTMIETMVDESISSRIARLGTNVLAGEEISRADALWLFEIEDTADISDLMTWSNRIRAHFKGN